MPAQNLHREDEARRDLSATVVSRPVAWCLVVFWLGTLSLVGGREVARALRDRRIDASTGAGESDLVVTDSMSSWQRLIEAGSRFARYGRELERDIENRGELAQRLRFVQRWLFDHLGLPAAGVFPGRNGWMYFEPDLNHVIGPGFLDPGVLAARRRESRFAAPDPLPAIVEFHRELASRGVRLVVMPVPAKPSLVVTPLMPRLAEEQRPIENASFREFIVRLNAAGVEVVDAGQILSDQSRAAPDSLFLKSDTHWTPRAVETVARELAGRLGSLPFEAVNDHRLREENRLLSGTGDLARLLAARAEDVERVETWEVVETPSEDVIESRPEVILLGDSFVNIYSDPQLGWGEHAGLRERLQFYLQTPVLSVALNDRGASASRQELARAWRVTPERFSRVQTVIWEFAARELTAGDWKIIPLPPENRSETVAQPELAGEVRVAIEAAGLIPDPRATPYPDALLALKCLLVSSQAGDQDATAAEHGSTQPRQMLIYVWGFRDRVETPAARWQIGNEVRFKLTRWADVESRLGRTARIEMEELNDADLELPVYFGEPIP